jgi:hypothetical protein
VILSVWPVSRRCCCGAGPGYDGLRRGRSFACELRSAAMAALSPAFSGLRRAGSVAWRQPYVTSRSPETSEG